MLVWRYRVARPDGHANQRLLLGYYAIRYRREPKSHCENCTRSWRYRTAMRMGSYASSARCIWRKAKVVEENRPIPDSQGPRCSIINCGCYQSFMGGRSPFFHLSTPTASEKSAFHSFPNFRQPSRVTQRAYSVTFLPLSS